MRLKERVNRIADELHFDLRDPYTRVLATAMAAVEMDDEVRPVPGLPFADLRAMISENAENNLMEKP